MNLSNVVPAPTVAAPTDATASPSRARSCSVKRNQLLAVATSIAAAVALAACSSSGGGPSHTQAPNSHAASGSTGASAASCSGTPVMGGTLVTGRQNQTLSLNPHHTPGGWGDGEAINLIYENLVKMDPTGKTSGIV